MFKARRAHLKANTLRAPQTYRLISAIIELYARRFRVKIEQLSIQPDHVHILLRCGKRSHFHYFFRVVAGQIAQRLGVTDTPRRERLWIYRPFSRVVRGWKAYKIVRNYIQLNEKEALGEIPYRKTRLRGLTVGDWEALWS